MSTFRPLLNKEAKLVWEQPQVPKTYINQIGSPYETVLKFLVGVSQPRSTIISTRVNLFNWHE